jgi:hypothetical protein
VSTVGSHDVGSPELTTGSRGRLSAAAGLALALVLLAMAAPAVAADAGHGQPVVDRGSGAARTAGTAARRAGAEDIKVGTVLNGLITAAESAVGATGPPGFVLGASLFFIKQLIGSSDGADEAEGAYAKLTEIDSKLTDLKNQLGENVFDLQVGKTDDYIVDIRQAASDLRDALEHAKKADNKALTDQERAKERRSFNSSMAEFLDDAHKLVQDNVAAKLNSALIDYQEEGDPRNPVKKPALLTQLRRRIAGEKFLTTEKSARIREFFRYYQWAQVRLATVLTEYYMLGGPCTWSPPANYCDKSKPAEADPGRAEDRVAAIKANIELQRVAAGLPKKYLDEAPLEGRVFIDVKSNFMWGIEPTYRSSAQITRYGSFRGCGVRKQDYPEGPTCRLDARDRFAGYDWVVPSMAEAKTLFNGRDGDPISWLKTAGVTFNNRNGTRFPGYRPNQLSSQVALWMRDGWSLGVPSRSTIFDDYTRDLDDVILELADRDGRPYGSPQEFQRPVGFFCPVHQSLSPYYPIYNAPDCKRPNESVGGFILWVRSTTAADREDYYVTPPR